jgi:DNA invertase Pin-like site-specific DNA recombinase
MSQLGHGGKRKGAGRPRINISISRVLKLFDQGITKKEIAKRFEVSDVTIGRIIKRRNDV